MRRGMTYRQNRKRIIRKKNSRVSMAILFCCLMLLSVFPPAACAVEVSKQNWAFEFLRHGNIMTLKTNQYTADRPVIVFFPGTLESDSIVNTARWIQKYGLYDDLEADVIAACFRSKPLKPNDWEGPVGDLLEFLKEKHEAAAFPVVCDAVSASGYGGCYLVQLFNESGIPVRELNLADACIPRYVNEEWIRELAAMGTQVNIWGCRASGSMSAEARRLIEVLQGTENVGGAVLDTTHGQVLRRAMDDYGVHAEYRRTKRTEGTN